MEEKKKEQKVCPYAKKCGGCKYQGIPYKAQLGKKQDQVKIYREGTICSYAPEFGKTEQIQVLALAWEGDGSEHMTQIIFEREREKHHD